jgi:hypothetical protein
MPNRVCRQSGVSSSLRQCRAYMPIVSELELCPKVIVTHILQSSSISLWVNVVWAWIVHSVSRSLWQQVFVSVNRGIPAIWESKSESANPDWAGLLQLVNNLWQSDQSRDDSRWEMRKMGLLIMFQLEITTNQWKVRILMPHMSLRWSVGFSKSLKHRIGIQIVCKLELSD